ncbi:MAG: glycoside hydrolase family 25 protein [Erysipelotrichaceae bacterium]|nr:glycoside hydrolase family 25 protein [Erysipelotrichaceae bacterium]
MREKFILLFKKLLLIIFVLLMILPSNVYAASNVPTAPSNTVAVGVDISKWQGDIDFSKLAKEVDFVIIRCGYVKNGTAKTDAYFETYVKGCRDNNIPYGIYLYSYATTVSEAKTEGNHALSLVNKLSGWNTYPSLPIFYDMEDNSTTSCSAKLKAQMAEAFCDVLENAGYITGIYANKNWWTNYLTNSYFDDKIKWVAQYNTKCTYSGDYAIWQCTSSASVSGVSGNVDYNYMVDNVCNEISLAKVGSISTQYYTGSAIKPNPTVTYNNHTLTKGTDYKVSYSNNINAGTATITITGINNYSGTISKTFTIQKNTFSPTVSAYSGTYDGNAHTITIKNIPSDATVEYRTSTSDDWSTTKPTRTSPGTTTVYYRISKTNYVTYTGSSTIKIAKKTFSPSVSGYDDIYDGNAHTITIGNVPEDAIIEYRTSTSDDWTTTLPTRSELGTTTVYYRISKENYETYSGSTTIRITKKLSDSKISISQTSYTYDGNAKKPIVTVVDGTTTLTKDTDYTVTYSNNTNAGSASITISGIGIYSGTVTKTFTIKKATYKPTVKAYSGSYDGSSHAITLSGVKSGSTIQYRTSSKGTWTTTKPTRTNTGTTTVYYQITNDNYETITGNAKISISKRNVSSLSISLSKTSYTYDGKAKKPSVTVKYNGKAISTSNYTITYSSGRTKVGTYKVTIKAKGNNLTGSVTKTFKINPVKTSIKSLTKAKKAFTVKWTKKSAQVSGYQIQYSTSSKFSSSKTKTITSYRTTSKKITGLKSKTKYYVRIRTYKTVNGTKYYSGWSSTKTITTK